ncbi:leucine-rich repeat domain-containing protein [Lactococcus taiwanensis]|uniref:leucine-rich repeat domain-containing protein n=1 Tax=Lactococcus taiwanensis TaxID=1151742 RepID=UPI0028B0168E|nr:leucine-rich repeat domain-containing protein [Lactococcus taiwanensis]
MRKNQLVKVSISLSVCLGVIYPYLMSSPVSLSPWSAHAATVNMTYTDEQQITYTLDDTLKTAEVTTYSGKPGLDIIIPDNLCVNGKSYAVTSIGTYAFLNSGIHSVVIGNNVSDINTSAFQTTTAAPDYYKKALIQVTLGTKVQNIKTDAFAGNALSQLILPDALQKIATRAFSNNQLTTLSIGKNVTDIMSKAFQSNQLTTISFDPSAQTIVGSAAFSGSPVLSLTLGTGVYWPSDALNKASLLFNQLDDLPETGIRSVSISPEGSCQKSWLLQAPLEEEVEKQDDSNSTPSLSGTENSPTQDEIKSLETTTTDATNFDSPTTEDSGMISDLAVTNVQDSGPSKSSSEEVQKENNEENTNISPILIESPELTMVNPSVSAASSLSISSSITTHNPSEKTGLTKTVIPVRGLVSSNLWMPDQLKAQKNLKRFTYPTFSMVITRLLPQSKAKSKLKIVPYTSVLGQIKPNPNKKKLLLSAVAPVSAPASKNGILKAPSQVPQEKIIKSFVKSNIPSGTSAHNKLEKLEYVFLSVTFLFGVLFGKFLPALTKKNRLK